MDESVDWLTGQNWVDQLHLEIEERGTLIQHDLIGVIRLLEWDTLIRAFPWRDTPQGQRCWEHRDVEILKKCNKIGVNMWNLTR